ncbi:MAG: 5'-nucleotidase C-terminal domain-containing protein [Fervidobacterium sp.]
MKMNKISLLGALVAFFFAVLGFSSQIVVLHTSNIYGNVLPYNYFNNTYQSGGLAIIKTYVDDLREKNKDVLLIDTGNLLYGSPFGDFSKTKNDIPVIDTFNKIKYDAFVPGTFELNYPPEKLLDVFSKMKAKVLASNLKGLLSNNIESYYIKTSSEGFKIAVVGVVTTYKSGNLVDYKTAVRNTLKTVKSKNPDLIILATSGGITNSPISGKSLALKSDLNIGDELVKEFSNDVDIFLFGNQDVVYTSSKSNKVYSIAGSEGTGVNKITIVAEKENNKFKIKSIDIKRVDFAGIIPSEEILNSIAVFEAEFNKWLDESIATSTVSSGFNKYMTILDDNLITEIVNKSIIDYVFANAGTWNVFNPSCQGISEGPITRRDIYSFVGKTTTIKLVELTGKDIKEIINNSVNLLNYDGTKVIFKEPLITKPWLFDLFENIEYGIVLNEKTVRNVLYAGKPLEEKDKLLVSVPTVRTYGTLPILKGKVVKDFEIPVQEILFNSFANKEISAEIDGNRSSYVKLEYVVKPGDTFNQLVQRLAVSAQEFLELNPIIKDINLLRPRWKLVYYKKYLDLIPPLREIFELK